MRHLALIPFLWWCACSPSSTAPDSNFQSTDTGIRADLGSFSPDAAPIDSGQMTPDLGMTTPDSGVPLDSGAAEDSGVVADSGAADAVVAVDTGPAADAGQTMDASMPIDMGDPNMVEVELVVVVPSDTPANDPVHIAGDFQSWDPADSNYRFTRQSDGLYSLRLQFMRGTSIAFKFARGDWSKVEKDANGAEIMNRTLTLNSSGRHSFTVARWADTVPGNSTRTGNIQTITVPNYLNGRRVWVYLPPNYATTTTTSYPVLYMLDGQNVFDRATSFSGEWQVDETAEQLIGAGEIEPLIVVAVDNGGASRIHEYTPWADPTHMRGPGGGGMMHVSEMISTLIPYINQNYRTRTGPANTGFSGSSLGGLMSVYVAYTHANTFGKVAGLSPSIWWKNEELVSYVRTQPKPSVAKLWVDMGTLESGVTALGRLTNELTADGFVLGQDLRSETIMGAGHNEPAWAARFPDILRFLFPR